MSLRLLCATPNPHQLAASCHHCRAPSGARRRRASPCKWSTLTGAGGATSLRPPTRTRRAACAAWGWEWQGGRRGDGGPAAAAAGASLGSLSDCLLAAALSPLVLPARPAGHGARPQQRHRPADAGHQQGDGARPDGRADREPVQHRHRGCGPPQACWLGALPLPAAMRPCLLATLLCAQALHPARLLASCPPPPPRAAGYETTANALAFAIYLLATHPEAEARMLAEIDAFGGGVRGEPSESWAELLGATCPPSPAELSIQPASPPHLPPSTQEPGPGDADRFPYVQAVMDEALRLFPPAHTTNRECTAAEGCTLTAQDGTQYYIPHRVWVSPERRCFVGSPADCALPQLRPAIEPPLICVPPALLPPLCRCTSTSGGCTTRRSTGGSPPASGEPAWEKHWMDGWMDGWPAASRPLRPPSAAATRRC